MRLLAGCALIFALAPKPGAKPSAHKMPKHGLPGTVPTKPLPKKNTGPALPFKPGKLPDAAVKLGPAIVVSPPVTGDLSCRRGDRDCNVCTPNVRGQFAKMRRGDARWKTKPWRFEWNRAYPPQSTKPSLAFDADTDAANWVGLSKAHTQAFVRTNGGPYWYAGTHSQKESERPGTVFIVKQRRNGKKFLYALHRTKTKHPNGLHVLGDFLLFAERPDKNRDDELRILDLQRPHARQLYTHEIPTAVGESRAMKQFGGGLGTAKLSDGSYLLVGTVPGDRKDRQSDGRVQHRYNQFYNLRGSLTDPAKMQISFLAEQRYAPTQRVGMKYQYSENLSVITECGTGDLYTIHSSGDGEAADGLEGGGYWRLSKVVKRNSVPQLESVDVFEMSQSAGDCHMRSAASVGVGPNGKLEFLCHQYRKDPDPSVLNPFGGNTSGNDQWRFKAGVPKD